MLDDVITEKERQARPVTSDFGQFSFLIGKFSISQSLNLPDEVAHQVVF